MKKLFIIIVLVLMCGCNSKNIVKKQIKNEKKQEETKKEKYVDLNDTKIGIYKEINNKIELLKEYKTDIKSGIDIGVFQIFPSLEEEIVLDNGFGNSFYNAWTNLNYQNLKIGFNLKYKIDDKEINHTILNPNDTIKNEYIFTYLYDDYKNRNSNFYSHIENDEYNEESYFTSIKLYADSVDNLNSKIEFSVFTYDTEDDFDKSGNYRGNSIYTITICDVNKTC